MNSSLPQASPSSVPGCEGGETAFVPVEGQSFSCKQDWINRATRALTRRPEYNNTEHGETRGWRGPHFTALCFDQAGNRMRCGGDFERATDEGTYPVWWVWPDQIVPLLQAALGASADPTAGGCEGEAEVHKNPTPKEPDQ